MTRQDDTGATREGPIKLDVYLQFEDYAQAYLAVERLMVRKQRKAQISRPMGLVVIALCCLIGAAVLFLLPRLGYLDAYKPIRPPAYAFLSLFVPLVCFGVASLIGMAAVSGIWRTAGWVLVLMVPLSVIVFFELRGTAQAARTALEPDWYGTLFPHTTWLLMTAVIAWTMIVQRRNSRRKLWSLQPRLMQPKQVTLDSNGVTVEEPGEFLRLGWSAFQRFSEMDDVLLLWTSDVTFQILPRRSFASTKDVEAARQLFEANITDAEQAPTAFEVITAK